MPSVSALKAAFRQRIAVGHEMTVYDHLARAQHRGAGDARHARQLRPQVLDDDLAVAQHLVDLQRDALAGAATFTDATWTMTICPDGYLVRKPPESCTGHF